MTKAVVILGSAWTNTRLKVRYHWKVLLAWSIALILVCCTLSGRGDAWTTAGVYQPFPNGEATIILHRFCFTTECPLEQQE